MNGNKGSNQSNQSNRTRSNNMMNQIQNPIQRRSEQRDFQSYADRMFEDFGMNRMGRFGI